MAGYRTRTHTDGRPRLYRFVKPADTDAPVMLELFARRPEHVIAPEDVLFTRISSDDATSSLSAILLDDDCFAFILRGRVVIGGVPVVRAEYLVPLKASAWLDLSERRTGGEAIDARDVSKCAFAQYARLSPGGTLEQRSHGHGRRGWYGG